jgi:lysophospholipase L1-like esterase
MARRLLVLVTTAAFALAVAPAARAQAPTLAIAPSAVHTGWIGVQLAGPPGAKVTLTEGARQLRVVTLGSNGVGGVQRLARWRCDRTTREITATGGGSAPVMTTIGTPGCADRFVLRSPAGGARAGRALRVRVADGWRSSGPGPTVCLRMRGRDVDCAGVRLRGATGSATLYPIRAGGATLTLTGAGLPSQSRAVRVRARDRRLRVLAAGDSMMQILDRNIARRLPRARVRSDTHISTGITKPSLLNWPAQARRRAGSLRPDATVMFLGANDGFGLPHPGGGEQVPCCSDPWVEAYATRARAMMRSFARNGAGRVYWLTLPTPRSAAFARVFDGVNAGIRRAAAAFPGQVRVIDLGRVFTPGGQYRQTLRRNGRTVTVRQRDGVHLSPAGDAIAASLVIAAMRRDGLVQRR